MGHGEVLSVQDSPSQSRRLAFGSAGSGYHPVAGIDGSCTVLITGASQPGCSQRGRFGERYWVNV